MNIREEGQERQQPNDVHPKGGYSPDGNKLAIMGCNCRYCVQEQINHDLRRDCGRVW